VRLEGLGKLKNPMTSGMEPETFRLVTYCLNQLRYRVLFTAIDASTKPLRNSSKKKYEAFGGNVFEEASK
jgi:hypothetical protein